MDIWSQASALAAQTPEDRNKYVDFLRGVSILFVITGHWLIATAYYDGDTLTPGDLLDIQPWTQWLTWLFQVMPIFFIVGGYANAVSLESAERKGTGASVPGAPRQIVGAAMICLGIAFLARFGYGGGPFAGFDLLSFGLVVVGSMVSGLLPVPWRSRRA